MRGPYVPPPLGGLAMHYDDGECVRVLSSRYDVSETTVRNYLAAAGVRMRPRGAPPGNDHAKKERR